MSAYVVSRGHIRYLVEAGLSRAIRGGGHCGPFSWIWGVDHAAGTYERGQLTQENAGEVGQMLWDENVRSVKARYPGSDDLPGPIGETYDYGDHRAIWHHVIDPVQVLKACDCYEYQSCETDDWPETQAYAFVTSLRKSAWQALPGYEAASWGVPKRFEEERVA